MSTGLWILAHKVGHGAFSPYQTLNDLLSWFTHSTLLVLYFSCKYSHHHHHTYAGHTNKDMAVAPQTRADCVQNKHTAFIVPELFEDVPVVQYTRPILHHRSGGHSTYFSTHRQAKAAYSESHFQSRVSPARALFACIRYTSMTYTTPDIKTRTDPQPIKMPGRTWGTHEIPGCEVHANQKTPA